MYQVIVQAIGQAIDKLMGRVHEVMVPVVGQVREQVLNQLMDMVSEVMAR